jgi:hypothetical protein
MQSSRGDSAPIVSVITLPEHFARRARLAEGDRSCWQPVLVQNVGRDALHRVRHGAGIRAGTFVCSNLNGWLPGCCPIVRGTDRRRGRWRAAPSQIRPVPVRAAIVEELVPARCLIPRVPALFASVRTRPATAMPRHASSEKPIPTTPGGGSIQRHYLWRPPGRFGKLA